MLPLPRLWCFLGGSKAKVGHARKSPCSALPSLSTAHAAPHPIPPHPAQRYDRALSALPPLLMRLPGIRHGCPTPLALAQINDRYEFPDELDLDRPPAAAGEPSERPFMAASADRNVHNTYRLLAVLVHSGGVHGGHYYAFIRWVGRGGQAGAREGGPVGGWANRQAGR